MSIRRRGEDGDMTQEKWKLVISSIPLSLLFHILIVCFFLFNRIDSITAYSFFLWTFFTAKLDFHKLNCEERWDIFEGSIHAVDIMGLKLAVKHINDDFCFRFRLFSSSILLDEYLNSQAIHLPSWKFYFCSAFCVKAFFIHPTT